MLLEYLINNLLLSERAPLAESQAGRDPPARARRCAAAVGVRLGSSSPQVCVLPVRGPRIRTSSGWPVQSLPCPMLWDPHFIETYIMERDASRAALGSLASGKRGPEPRSRVFWADCRCSGAWPAPGLAHSSSALLFLPSCRCVLSSCFHYGVFLFFIAGREGVLYVSSNSVEDNMSVLNNKPFLV